MLLFCFVFFKHSPESVYPNSRGIRVSFLWICVTRIYYPCIYILIPISKFKTSRSFQILLLYKGDLAWLLLYEGLCLLKWNCFYQNFSPKDISFGILWYLLRIHSYGALWSGWIHLRLNRLLWLSLLFFSTRKRT